MRQYTRESLIVETIRRIDVPGKNLPPDDEIREIAQSETDETFQSITDLDNISDTTTIAITFLLAAIASWTNFAVGELDGDLFLQGVFIALTGLTLITIGLSMNYLARSLFPRSFYGNDVGKPFLIHSWRPWDRTQEQEVKQFEYLDDEGKDAEDRRAAFEKFLETYGEPTEIEDHTDFLLARLFNYKRVAQLKAMNTAYGLAWLRIAVVLFILTALVTLIIPYFRIPF